MATTMFFEEALKDAKDKSKCLDVEFGRTSLYQDNLMYLRVGNTLVVLSEENGKAFCRKVAEVSRHLGYGT